MTGKYHTAVLSHLGQKNEFAKDSTESFHMAYYIGGIHVLKIERWTDTEIVQGMRERASGAK